VAWQERPPGKPSQTPVKIRVISKGAELVLKKATPKPIKAPVTKDKPEPKPKVAPQKLVPVPQPKPAKQGLMRSPNQEKAPPPAVAPQPNLEHVAKGTDAEVTLQVASYSDALRQFISKHRVYPTMARRLKQQGTVEVEFKVLADGAIREVKIKRPSGYALIDDASLELLAKLKAFRPLPGGLASRTFVVPIRYKLR